MKRPQPKLSYLLVLKVAYAKEQLALDEGVCDKQAGLALLQKKPYKTTNPIGYWLRQVTKE